MDHERVTDSDGVSPWCTVFHRIRQCGQHGRWALPQSGLVSSSGCVECAEMSHNRTQCDTESGKDIFFELFNEMGSTAWQCDPKN